MEGVYILKSGNFFVIDRTNTIMAIKYNIIGDIGFDRIHS